MKNYFRERKIRRKNNLEDDKRVGKLAILNVLLACFLWILSVVVAGMGEYPNSAWTLIGMFLPGILYFSVRKDIRIFVRILLVANIASLFYPLIAFKNVIGSNEMGGSGTLYIIVVPLFAIALFVTSWELWKAMRPAS